MSVAVALLQVLTPDGEAVADRVDRVMGLVAEAAAGNDVVILPELWPIGAFAVGRMVTHAEPLGGPLCQRMAETATRTGVWLFGGSFPEVAGADHFNTQVVFAPSGELVAAYRKIHTFGFSSGETTVMRGGRDLAVLDTPLGLAGLATCYDIRFPEMFRALVDRGAQAFVIPAGWPSSRIQHWRALAIARAIEDQAYVLACNAAGTHRGVEIGGHSLVVDPRGDVLAEAGAGEEVLSLVLDPSAVTRWRSEFPVLGDRRIGTAPDPD